ncbi:MAG TPA: hypothetical protein VND93_16195 [Myxococcales bacterium]|nr:hypothetical protein [Myxococcales bacterium]
MEQALQRASETLARLGVMPGDPERRRKLVIRVDLFLWKFLKLRWGDAHRFFAAVEPIEAMELLRERFQVGRTLAFLSERQHDEEWENTLTVGVSLLYAAMRQCRERGFEPSSAGLFTLQRMLEQAVEGVDDLKDLLAVGAPL